jgi:hypothetical protein
MLEQFAVNWFAECLIPDRQLRGIEVACAYSLSNLARHGPGFIFGQRDKGVCPGVVAPWFRLQERVAC